MRTTLNRAMFNKYLIFHKLYNVIDYFEGAISHFSTVFALFMLHFEVFKEVPKNTSIYG